MTDANAHVLRPASMARSKEKSKRYTSKRGFPQTTGEANFAHDISLDSNNRTVNIEPLKIFVSQSFPKGHPLRELLAVERSILSIPDYLAKIESWQSLLRVI